MLIIALYGLFCLFGGLMGYLKAGSIASLASGGGAGFLLLIAALLIAFGKRWPALFTLVISGALGARFLLTPNFKVMPHLIMVILSALALLTSLVILVRNRRSSTI